MTDSFRVYLKTLQWEDMAFVRQLWADPETMAPVGGVVLLSDEQAEQWFNRMTDPANESDCYRLVVNEDGQCVGEVSSHRLDRATMTGQFNLKICHAHRRKGYAQEAMRLFLDYFFGAYGGQVMIDSVAFDNRLGQKALLQFGFEHDPGMDDCFMLKMTRQRYYRLYGKEDVNGGFEK